MHVCRGLFVCGPWLSSLRWKVCILQFSTAFDVFGLWDGISAFGLTELAYVAAVSPLNL